MTFTRYLARVYLSLPDGGYLLVRELQLTADQWQNHRTWPPALDNPLETVVYYTQEVKVLNEMCVPVVRR